MQANPFQRALEAVVKPLRFAAANDFANLERVRDLEASVSRGARRAAELAIPKDARRALTAVADAFAESLDATQRRKAIAAALDRIEPFADPNWAEAALSRPLSVLPGVGTRRAEALARRGLSRVSDLLFQLPSRYDDRRALAKVGDLEVGHRATFLAQVQLVDFVAGRGRAGRFRRILKAVVGDETGTVNLAWFRGGESIRQTLHKGETLLVTGDVRRYRFSKEIHHPEIQRVAEEPGESPEPANFREIVSDYPVLEGIHPRALRRLVAHALAEFADLTSSHLPARLGADRRLPEMADALRAIHEPSLDADPEALATKRTLAHERLILEELYLLEIGLALRRAAAAAEPGIPLAASDARIRAVLGNLPFALTAAQERAWGEIRADLARQHPMNRLLQGDVGSGKTVVAFLAAIAAAERGAQSALMAPTELLAEQHERTLRSLARGEAALRIGLLTSSRPRPEAEGVRSALAAGELDLVVGTHALVQGEVEFAHLALAIVDEQHRFGVLQRAALVGKARDHRVPHVLVMTATPIPRTLALTLYGDLDLSVIDELPPGRSPVITHVLRAGEGRRVVDLIRQTAERGEQVYVVYPLVEESEKIDLRAALESTERIRAVFPNLRIDLVHGRLDAGERAEVMSRFERGETDVLVSTTVIEVGVDVPNATLMVVEHAERFGLAQLHQLRGRVGRGERPGTCLLVARAQTTESEARLRAMVETTDGFLIADADLRIRGPGEFLGTRQHGRLPDLRIADLVRDARLVSVAREAALETVRLVPGLARTPSLARAVQARWGDRLALIAVG